MAPPPTELFIQPGVNLQPSDGERLKHFATLSRSSLLERWRSEPGQAVLQEWKRSGFDRATLERQVGKYYGQTDLRGIVLAGEDLTGRDLSHVDFFAADLHGADLSRSDLTETWLSHANLRGTRFDFSRMGGVLIDDADFDARTSFVGVDLNAVKFTLAVLLQDLAQGQQRIEHLKRRSPLLAWCLWITTDYGRSLGRWLAWCGAIILLFGLVFAGIPGLINKTGMVDGLYFSTVTFTTLGYGDIVPIGTLGKLLVLAEVAMGYLMGGLLVSVLARKVILG
ncbi:MAG: pentapeptide repeat-containing protein [Planctomycetes bacterium]|nr:pentapeptide repeat-containing protein [Planctomycetota bacterium]